MLNLKNKITKGISVILALFMLASCTAPSGGGAATQTPQANSTQTEAPAANNSIDINLSENADQKISLQDLGMSEYAATQGVGLIGLDGNPTVSPLDLFLTSAEVETLRAGNFKVGINFHYTGNDWAALQESALRNAFEFLGIEVVALADSENTPEKQVSDLETMMAMKPDAIVSAITDPAMVENTFDKIAQAGIKIVFMENVPNNYTDAKKDNFVAMVTCDSYGNGVAAAEIMAEKLGEEGEIGFLYWERRTPSQVSRQQGFEDTIAKYPNIKVVATEGFEKVDSTGTLTDALLVKQPDLDALFAPWDIPAEYAAASAISAGRNDLIITTVDLGQNCGRIIAEDGPIKGTGAALPYDQGIAEAVCVAYTLLGKELPGQYVAVPTFGVNRENLLEAYELVFHTGAPEEYKNLLGN
ncbi:MAG: substrate-binding domain-containing protein [Clostridiales bacterium]|nr:substrate-binding domain-containing protein [Clostridiales bacterium]